MKFSPPRSKGLLAKIALGWFEANREWTDFAPYDDLEEHALDELADWLGARLGVTSLEALTVTPSELPDFAQSITTWCRALEEAAVIEPIPRALRDYMWRVKPELGLWYSMSFGLYADGHVLPYGFDYETRPVIAEKPADLTEARADLLRAPRQARWVPVWLAASQEIA
jgi:hypothetical protein